MGDAATGTPGLSVLGLERADGDAGAVRDANEAVGARPAAISSAPSTGDVWPPTGPMLALWTSTRSHSL
jgi:hypothetical protein